MTLKYQVFAADSSLAETKQFLGRDHLVVPVVLLKEGVIQCMTCPTPELVTAKEFAKFEEMWNGRPITIGHPIRGGVPVSANTTSVLETEAIGTIFDVRLDGDKLKGNAWLDLERVEALGSDVIDRINDGQQIEVSTGYFADVAATSGKFNGEAFGAIQSDIKPDHLAILPAGDFGACSWKEGCGLPRLNSIFKCPNGFTDMIVGKDGTLKANCGSCEGCECKVLPGEIIAEQVSAEIVKGVVTKGPTPAEINARLLKVYSTGLSDHDRRAALDAALENEDDGFSFPFVLDVFEDTVVFMDGMGKVLERSFAIESDGSISLGEELTEVRPETSFVPVRTNKEIKAMSKKTKAVDALIANQGTRFTEDEREWLTALESVQLELLDPVEVEAPAEVKETEEDVKPPAEVAQEATSAQTPEEVFANIANPELREHIKAGFELFKENKAKLVAGLMANAHNTFTQEELDACDLANLEKLTALAGPPPGDYTAKGGTKLAVVSNAAPSAPAIFPRKTAS